MLYFQLGLTALLIALAIYSPTPITIGFAVLAILFDVVYTIPQYRS